ncbi:MAG: hypothetical protein GYA21_15490 [Myxococcales bacterium]|nr:hypothetical protein [Myxococcales bacterium]
MKRRSAPWVGFLWLAALVFGAGCDVFLPAAGGPDQPCLENGTCKTGLVCLSGTCRPGCVKDSDCGDDIACTRDGCHSGVCSHVAEDARCPDDGQFCNGIEYCDELLGCQRRDEPCPGRACDEGSDVCVSCGDGVVTAAAGEQCDPGPPQNDVCCDPTTCRWAANGVECGERFCAFMEWWKHTCEDHQCTGEALAERCLDASECTVDSCDEALGCVHTPLMNGSECGSRYCQELDWRKQVCQDAVCVETALVASCDDIDSCTEDTCDPVNGCLNQLVPNTLPDICGSGSDENCDGIVDGCCGPEGTFAVEARILVGTAPRGIAVADLDRDAILDVVAADSGSNGVSVLLGGGSDGRGDGTFQAKADYAAGTGPSAIAVGDFNRDGNPDLAVANRISNDVSILLGKSGGEYGAFLPAVNYATGTGPSAIVSGDFNRDAILDLAVANAGSNNVSVLLGGGSGGRGDGTFGARVDYGAGTGPAGIVTGDFNRDAILDLAVANAGSNDVSVLLGGGSGGRGDGTFLARVDYAAGTGPSALETGDFNRDAILDLAVANAGSNDVSVLLGNGSDGCGDGTFGPRVDYAAGTGPSAVTVTDFDKDGILDLAVGNASSNNLSVLFGNGSGGRGDGTFGAKVDYAAGTTPAALTTGDFNEDGILDLLAANAGSNDVSLLPGRGSGARGDGAFGAAMHLSAAASVYCAITADLNADGVLDIVATDDETDQVSVFLGVGVDGRGTGTFSNRVEYGTGDTPAYLALGDFNADGIPDIVATNFLSNSVSALLGNGSGGRGNGTYQSRRDFETGSRPRGVATGDFNADGILDLAVVNVNSDSLSVLLGSGADGRGDGSFATKVDYPVDDQPRIVAVGDFNSDGISDLVVVNTGADTVKVLLGRGSGGRGDGAFTIGDAYPTDDQPRFVAIGDFNADRIQDLVVACGGASTVNVFMGTGSEGRGDGKFSPRLTFPVGLFPTGVAVADLDGDGIQDLVVANTTAGTLSTLLGRGVNGRGDGSFGEKSDFPTGGESFTVVLGDFNSDGILDAASGNQDTKNVAVLLEAGACLPSP